MHVEQKKNHHLKPINNSLSAHKVFSVVHIPNNDLVLCLASSDKFINEFTCLIRVIFSIKAERVFYVH